MTSPTPLYVFAGSADEFVKFRTKKGGLVKRLEAVRDFPVKSRDQTLCLVGTWREQRNRSHVLSHARKTGMNIVTEDGEPYRPSPPKPATVNEVRRIRRKMVRNG